MASSPPSERRLLGAVGAVRRDEWPFALLMFTYVFLVIGTFWILKPLKKGLFIEFYDKGGFDLAGRHFGAAEAELLAKVLNMVVAILAVALFTWLARRFRRERLTAILMAGVRRRPPRLCAAGGDRPGAATVWSFYLFGDLFSTLMVATFFAFLNDSVTPEACQAPLRLRRPRRRCWAGSFGSSVIGVFIESLGASTWLYGCAAAACPRRRRGHRGGPSRGASRRGAGAGRGGAAPQSGHRRRGARLRARHTCCRSPPSWASTRSCRRSWTSSSPAPWRTSSMVGPSGRISRACSR